MTRSRVAITALGFVVAAVVAFGVLAPPEHCPPATVAALDDSSDAAVQWFVRNQQPDGTWLYEYDRASGDIPVAYNIVRHAGGTMGLYQAATAGIDGALGSADRGVDWARERLLEHDGWTALADERTAPVGATALLTAGLVERRLLTGDDGDDELLRALGRFMATMTRPDGAVIAQFDLATMEPIADSRSKYYTGEAYWALARLHRLFPGDGFGEVADRIGDYLATRRDEVEGIWPPVPDHWVAYGLAETVHFPERDPSQPLTAAELNYTRSQAGSFGAQVRWVSQQAGPWGVAVRGTRVPRGGGYGVIGEALTGLWRVAEVDARLADLRRPLADRAECIAGLAIGVQVRDGTPRQDGAWFIDDVTRMDDQQHAISALLRTTAIVETTPRPGHPSPSAWLWALALLGIMNPLAIGLAVPRRARPERATIGALGAAIGAAGVVMAALAGEPLFDALGVSRPAGRLAVGIVAAVVAVIRLARRTPSPQDGPPGWRAALVPVAVPLTATPALLLLGLSAGADHGALFVAGVLALGVGATTAAALVPTEQGTGRTVAAWGQRLITAAALAACVLLAIDAVFDV